MLKFKALKTPVWSDNYQIKDCKLQQIWWHTSIGWRTDMVLKFTLTIN